jgi:anti-sigma factor RsiW
MNTQARPETEANHPDPQTLSAFHDGELDAAGHAAVSQHLKSCGKCQAELDSIRALSGLFSGSVLPQAPAGLAQGIKDRVREDQSERETLRMARWLSGLAAGLLIVAGVGLFLRTEPASAQPQPLAWDPATSLIVADPSTIGQAGAEERQFAQWVVADLSGRLAMVDTYATGEGND